MSTRLHSRVWLVTMFGSEPYVLTKYHSDDLPHKKTSDCDPNTCIDLTREQAITYFQTIFTVTPIPDYVMDAIRLCINLQGTPSVTVHSTGAGQAWVDGQYWWHIPAAHNTYDPFYAIGQMLGRLLNVVNAQLPSNHDNRLAKEHLSYIERELDKLIKSRLRQR